MRLLFLFESLLVAATSVAQTQKASDVADFVSVDTPVFVLNHVRVIDGTGAPAKEDQAIVVANGEIQSIGPAASVQIPQGAQRMERSGYTVIPGLVGMHDHLYYTNSYGVQVVDGKTGEPGAFLAEIPYTAPRLYLAAGVTTIRTTGSLEPYADLKVKSRIDANLMPGPSIDATAPYLEGAPTRFAQMHELTGPDDAKRMVDYWAAEGMTSYKAYTNITRDELGVAIQRAHAHKLKVTGHLCSVTWPEAVALEIDDLEHGPVFTDTEFVADKKPDVCPAGGGSSSWAEQDVNGAHVQEMIRNLVSHHVAVTSTLPVYEAGAPGRPALEPRTLEAMSAESAQRATSPRVQECLWILPGRRCYAKRWILRWHSSRRGACCWPGLIQLETAAYCQVSAISAKSSYSWKRALLQWKRFRSLRRMAPYISAANIELGASRRANRQTSF